MSESFVTNVNTVKGRLISGFGTGVLWGAGFIAWGGGGYQLTFSPRMATWPWKRGKRRGKDIRLWSELSQWEPHAGKRKKNRGRRGGGDRVWLSQSLKPDRVPRGSLLKSWESEERVSAFVNQIPRNTKLAGERTMSSAIMRRSSSKQGLQNLLRWGFSHQIIEGLQMGFQV